MAGLQTVSSLQSCLLFRVPLIERFHCVIIVWVHTGPELPVSMFQQLNWYVVSWLVREPKQRAWMIYLPTYLRTYVPTYVHTYIPSHSGFFKSMAYPMIIVCCCQLTMIGENQTVSLYAFLYTLYVYEGGCGFYRFLQETKYPGSPSRIEDREVWRQDE